MNFSKVVQLSQLANNYQQIKLTRAQIEEIKKAGHRAIPDEAVRNLFYISTIDSEDVLMENGSAELKNLSEYTSRELREGGPLFFVISVKEETLPMELIYLYTGMIMATMQLQITDLFLGYSFSAPQEKVQELNRPEWKNKSGIPQDFTAIQILKVGYPEEAVEKRVPYLGNLLSRVLE